MEDLATIPAFLIEEETTEEPTIDHPVIIIKELEEGTTYNDLISIVKTVSKVHEEEGYLSTKHHFAILVLQKSQGIPRAKDELTKAKVGRIITTIPRLTKEELDPQVPLTAYAVIQNYESDEGISTREIENLIQTETKWISPNREKGTILVNFFTRASMEEWISTRQQLGSKLLKKEESFMNKKGEHKLWVGNLPLALKNSELSNMLKKAGLKVESVAVQRWPETNVSKRYAFVVFEDHESMLKAYTSIFKVKREILKVEPV